MAVNQLRIVVSILKELSEGSMPKAEDYGIEKEIYYNILDIMQDARLLKNVKISRGKNRRVILANLDGAQVTIHGLEYLNENSALMKTYKGLKEVREWLPF